jgi:beta-galactosidase beta subunit
MFANRPAANMAVYSVNGSTLLEGHKLTLNVQFESASPQSCRQCKYYRRYLD